jgi:hypothetical protein
MDNASTARINCAVDECLAGCTEGVDSIAEMISFLAAAERGGWVTPDELATVEAIVRRVLRDPDER